MTHGDWAIREAVASISPGTRIVPVMDDPDCHTIGTLYLAIPPEAAARFDTRLEIHYTPTHRN